MLNKIKNTYHLVQSVIFNALNGFPASKLDIIGVTGTDGKTTTSSMIYHILKFCGKKASLISTVAAYIGDEEIDTGLHVTTPDPWRLPSIIKKIISSGHEILVIEATSQGLEQNRLWGIEFSTAVFTNIGNDHLDYHGTWEKYANAKFRLARQLKKNGTLVINEDHEESFSWLKNAAENNRFRHAKSRFYSKRELKNMSQSVDGLSFEYDNTKFFIPVIGEYNFENGLAAIEATRKYVSLDKISKALSEFTSPGGRMEIMKTKPFTVIVDFAHTPDALENSLHSVKKILEKGGRVINVFGCAGKRDKGRRRMGKVSAELAGITVLTAEDPRDEDLKQVNNEILAYAKKAGGFLAGRFSDHKQYLKKKIIAIERTGKAKGKPVVAFDENSVKSRKDAIDFAISIAERGDVVFITGKGHEKSLSFGAKEKEYSWSDQEEVKRVLKRQELKKK
ncbi:UDP-N-acetylmuramyl-tripeptide synthetase [Candidatus Dojkabacteria bacterium]|nr:UDP-N-acetylmuramyl-tripeptide synthetase [Candidatus Dojkabacteria bacterium]